MFEPVSAELDFASLEEGQLARWKQHDVFARSMEQRAGAEPWVFYEGPPTANGMPGLHHVWARVYKDLFCRYQTMRGRRVDRRAGWDTHGLPVEVQVERQLGITGKRDIVEKIGVAEFVRQCRASVMTYVGEFERLTERIGYWTDMENAYFTFSPTYVDSVWWQLRQLFDRDLLYEDLKVVPYCPRCGTALSSHELGQPDVYRDEVDESATVRLEVLDAAAHGLASVRSLLVWTTTPWTLLSNVAVAVNPEITYAVVDGQVLAADLVEAVLGDVEVTETLPGSALVGLHYRRPFDVVALPEDVDACYVVAASYVTTEEGTGLVHQAPAFGEVDRVVAREHGLPTVNPVGPDGAFTAAAGWLAGRGVREANHDINDELERRGLLVRREDYTHALPHCWRCGTILIYWGKPSWYIATSRLKDLMMSENSHVDWHPAHIRDGRFGEWLANNVDWALSRDRFWGTPLPVWRCGQGHVTCVGSRAELGELAGRDPATIEPHRPDIDEVTFACPSCGELARRVEPVIDAWFDSGAMPSAQVGYPLVPGSQDARQFPADLVAEAIDQTRGWFYSLLAVNTLVFGHSPYRHVLCLGHIVDAQGRKMSKSVGNVIDPWTVLTTRGADALRWWMFSQGSPWTSTRASLEVIDLAMREMLGTLWNAVSFFTTYASLNAFDPADPAIPPASERPALDRWILSRLEGLTATLTAALDGYEPLPGTDALRAFVDDLSNWYVRRSRRRFWRTDASAPRSDSLAAHATMLEVLQRLALLLAPVTPFLADRLYHLVNEVPAEDSVHLQDWPRAVHDVDLTLEAEMSMARHLTSLGRAGRAEAGVKVRQPLRRALVFVAADAVRPPAGVVEDELNVDLLEFRPDPGDVLSFELVPRFAVLGPRLGDAVKELRGALARIDSAAAAEVLESGGRISVALAGTTVELGLDELELRVRSQGGFAVSRDGTAVVALDLEIDDDLRRRGLLRDVVRQVQDLRKGQGFDIADRIELWVSGLDDLAEEWPVLAREVLATAVHQSAGEGPGFALELDGRDARVWLRVRPR